MSRTEIAKQVGALSVGATALTLGVSSGATLGAIAGINLAILWRDLKSATIRSTHIRYFHAEDAALAKTAAAALGAQARDFTSYSPAPPVGQLEIWIAGRGASPGTSQGGRQNELADVGRDLREALTRFFRSIPPSDPL